MSAFFRIDDAELQAWASKIQVKATQSLKDGVQQSLKRIGTQAKREVTKKTPVGKPEQGGTGNLRRGWNLANAGILAVELYNNVEYASFVENGHRTRGGGGMGWVPGQFFMRDTLADITGTLTSLITPELVKALGGLID